jgi:hypothetical protein
MHPASPIAMVMTVRARQVSRILGNDNRGLKCKPDRNAAKDDGCEDHHRDGST